MINGPVSRRTRNVRPGGKLVNSTKARGVWAKGEAYDPYMGRWSRLVAVEFVSWLGVKRGSRWLDVGCGTGALSRAILEHGLPKEVVGLDLSANYLEYLRHCIFDNRLSLLRGDALALPTAPGKYDAVVSGLALNFTGNPQEALSEMARAARTDSVVALYVWDYADGMQLLRYFWDAAIKLNHEVRDLDEAQRSPICNPKALMKLFSLMRLEKVESRPIDVKVNFASFDDYWLPFLGGQGTVASYATSLTKRSLNELRDCIRAHLPISADGSVRMRIRAWAVKGRSASEEI